MFKVCKNGFQWKFRMKADDIYDPYQGNWEPAKSPTPKKRFERFQGIKIFIGDKSFRVNEEEFLKRYRSRHQLTNNQNFERFEDKYKTIMNWLCISYNEKELF
jgi:hypothetical protein